MADRPPLRKEPQQLLEAMIQAARGFDNLDVMSAAVNLIAAALGELAKEKGWTKEQALTHAAEINGEVQAMIEANWPR